VQDIYVVYQ